MNRVPITRSGIERRTFISSRIGCWSQSGDRLREQARPKGTAMITARKVPQSAICTVSHICAM